MKKDKLDQFLILKQKITPKGLEYTDTEYDRFTIADNILISSEEKSNKPAVLRKSFSIPETEITLFAKIKDRALDYRIVISESEIVRIGLMLLSNLQDQEFQKNIKNVKKITIGRPKLNNNSRIKF